MIDPCCFTRLEETLDQVDGLIIATPNHLHKDQTLTAMAHGISVLVEKPLATNMADAEAICRAEEMSSAVVAVGYASRFRQSVRFMHDLLSQQYFGMVNRFAFQYGTHGGWAPISNYNLKSDQSGGGVLVVTGSHFLDRMLYWFGYPTMMSLADDAAVGLEANAVAHFHFAQPDGGSCVGTARFSKTSSLPKGFVMNTEKGIVWLEEDRNASIKLLPNDGAGVELTLDRPTSAEEEPARDEFLLQIEDFIQAARLGRRPSVDSSSGMQSVRLIHDLYANRQTMPTKWYNTSLEESLSS